MRWPRFLSLSEGLGFAISIGGAYGHCGAKCRDAVEFYCVWNPAVPFITNTRRIQVFIFQADTSVNCRHG